MVKLTQILVFFNFLWFSLGLIASKFCNLTGKPLTGLWIMVLAILNLIVGMIILKDLKEELQ